MLRNIIYNLLGERHLFTTAVPLKYSAGKVVRVPLGSSHNVLFRVSRVVKSDTLDTLGGNTVACYEVWGKKERV